VCTFDEVLSERLERGSGVSERLDCSERVCDELGCVAAGLLDAKHSGPGSLHGCGVLAGRLAQLLGGLGDVEDIVDDLECKAGVFTERAQAGDDLTDGGVVGGCAEGVEAAGDDAGLSRRAWP
jgi:hypothetical protein